jgi:uncharacterized protein
MFWLQPALSRLSIAAASLAAAALCPAGPLFAAEAPKIGTPRDPVGQFIAAILGDTEDRWKEVFEQAGQVYRPPRLVLYRGMTEQPCGGVARAAMGPLYCPDDQKIYLDPSYLTELETRFRACTGSNCEVSAAFVIAREVGHHVQNLLGTLARVKQAQGGLDRGEANRLQMRLELQADCFAGVWLHHAARAHRGIEQRDIEAARQTAAALGDDRVAEQPGSGGASDGVSRGSSEQRARWLTIGVESGTVASCDTFAAGAP